MSDSHFTISLVFEHPSRDPGEITSALAIDPDRCWSKGAVRTGPDGQLLGGFHKENSWTKDLASASFNDRKLGKILSRITDDFRGHGDFFRNYRGDGGVIRLETFWTIGSSWPEERLDHALLTRLSELEIDLILMPIVGKASEEN